MGAAGQTCTPLQTRRRGQPPFCPTQAQAMSRVISPITGKPYGLPAVCRVWRLARSGVYRHLSASPPAQRRGPLGAMSDEALTTAIQGVLAASPFHGEGHRKVWARLRHAGTRTSLRRVLRLMRENDLLAPTRVGSPRGRAITTAPSSLKGLMRCGAPT